METDPKFWSDSLLYGTLLLVAVVAVLLYLSLIAAAYIRSRATVEVFLEVSRQVERQEEMRKAAGDAPGLAGYLELRSNLRSLLEQEGLLRKPETKK